MRLVKPPASPTNQLTPFQIRWQVLASPSAWPWLNRARRGCFDISRGVLFTQDARQALLMGGATK